MTARSLRRCRRLLLDARDPVALDGRHAEPAGVLDLLQQDPRPCRLGPERVHVRPQVVLVEVVPEDRHDAVAADVRPGLRERVRDPRLTLLVRVLDRHAEPAPSPSTRLHLIAVAADDDDQLRHARPRQRPHREVDHRLVEEVEHVLVDDLRHRAQARAEAAGQHHALHRSPSRNRITESRQSARGTPRLRARSRREHAVSRAAAPAPRTPRVVIRSTGWPTTTSARSAQVQGSPVAGHVHDPGVVAAGEERERRGQVAGPRRPAALVVDDPKRRPGPLGGRGSTG